MVLPLVPLSGAKVYIAKLCDCFQASHGVSWSALLKYQNSQITIYSIYLGTILIQWPNLEL